MDDLKAPLCACGCGRNVSGHKQWGRGKIVWNKYFSQKCPKGKQKGTKDKIIAARGYVFLYMPDHPHANDGLYVPEHVAIAETVLGKLLPKGSEVHHVDEDRQRNVNSNLVICQDRAYHMLLHQRTDALKACGNANFRKCQFCKEYGDPVKMRHYIRRHGYQHWGCWRSYMRKYYKNNKEKWGVNAEQKPLNG